MQSPGLIRSGQGGVLADLRGDEKSSNSSSQRPSSLSKARRLWDKVRSHVFGKVMENHDQSASRGSVPGNLGRSGRGSSPCLLSHSVSSVSQSSNGGIGEDGKAFTDMSELFRHPRIVKSVVENWRTLKGNTQTVPGGFVSQEEYVLYFTCCQRALMPTEAVSPVDVLREWYKDAPDCGVMSYDRFVTSIRDFVDRWTCPVKSTSPVSSPLPLMHTKTLLGVLSLLEFLCREVGGTLHEAAIGVSQSLKTCPVLEDAVFPLRCGLPAHTCCGGVGIDSSVGTGGVMVCLECPACGMIQHWANVRQQLHAQATAQPSVASIVIDEDDDHMNNNAIVVDATTQQQQEQQQHFNNSEDESAGVVLDESGESAFDKDTANHQQLREQFHRQLREREAKSGLPSPIITASVTPVVSVDKVKRDRPVRNTPRTTVNSPQQQPRQLLSERGAVTMPNTPLHSRPTTPTRHRPQLAAQYNTVTALVSQQPQPSQKRSTAPANDGSMMAGWEVGGDEGVDGNGGDTFDTDRPMRRYRAKAGFISRPHRHHRPRSARRTLNMLARPRSAPLTRSRTHSAPNNPSSTVTAVQSRPTSAHRNRPNANNNTPRPTSAGRMSPAQYMTYIPRSGTNTHDDASVEHDVSVLVVDTRVAYPVAKLVMSPNDDHMTRPVITSPSTRPYSARPSRVSEYQPQLYIVDRDRSPTRPMSARPRLTPVVAPGYSVQPVQFPLSPPSAVNTVSTKLIRPMSPSRVRSHSKQQRPQSAKTPRSSSVTPSHKPQQAQKQGEESLHHFLNRIAVILPSPTTTPVVAALETKMGLRWNALSTPSPTATSGYFTPKTVRTRVKPTDPHNTAVVVSRMSQRIDAYAGVRSPLSTPTSRGPVTANTLPIDYVIANAVKTPVNVNGGGGALIRPMSARQLTAAPTIPDGRNTIGLNMGPVKGVRLSTPHGSPSTPTIMMTSPTKPSVHRSHSAKRSVVPTVNNAHTGHQSKQPYKSIF